MRQEKPWLIQKQDCTRVTQQIARLAQLEGQSQSLDVKTLERLALQTPRQLIVLCDTTGFAVMLRIPCPFNPQKLAFYLAGLYVQEQGKGYGRALLQTCEKRASRLKAASFIVMVRTQNTCAAGFYAKMGYAERFDLDFCSYQSQRPKIIPPHTIKKQAPFTYLIKSKGNISALLCEGVDLKEGAPELWLPQLQTSMLLEIASAYYTSASCNGPCLNFWLSRPTALDLEGLTRYQNVRLFYKRL